MPRREMPPSMYEPAPKEGPGGQQRLFDLPPTKWEERAATERVPQGRTWADLTEKQRARTTETLRTTGVTHQGMRNRMVSVYQRAVDRAGGGAPQGQDFYASQQPEHFEHDAKRFNVPYHVIVAVNAVLSPKKRMTTATGIQENREAAYHVLRHVTSGKEGLPPQSGIGLKRNVEKAVGIVRQHLENGTHPLDAVNEEGKKLVSGPKVEAYYSNYMNPSRTTTDVWHQRIAYGPHVRSSLTDEENARRQELGRTFGRRSHQAARYIPKTPAEVLTGKVGVHEAVAHATEAAARQVGVTPSELQSVIWHQAKHEAGEPAPREPLGLFERPKRENRRSYQPTLSRSQFAYTPPQTIGDAKNVDVGF